MAKKKFFDKEAAKNTSMMANSDNSRESVTGYLERGNDALIHAKARTLRNNDNGSHF